MHRTSRHNYLARNIVMMSASTFSPSDIPNIFAWLDASTITGVIDGAGFAPWPDRSGNGRNATTAGMATWPVYRTGIINGYPAVLFDGTDTCLLANAWRPVNDPFTIFVVLKLNDTLGNVTLLQGQHGGLSITIDAATKLITVVNTSHVGIGTNVVPLSTASFSLIDISYTTPDLIFRTNCAVDTSVVKAGLVWEGGIDTLSTSSSNNAFGDYIAEIILYQRALDLSEKLKVEHYLNNKYALGFSFSPYAMAPATLAKVQLHQHTTGSDGADTPEDAVAKYVARGFDAMAITDHDVYTAVPAGIVGIQGVEESHGDHILALGTQYVENSPDQHRIDDIVALGGKPVICHPDNNSLTYATLAALTNYTGIEIYNALCIRIPASYRGFAISTWDSLLNNVSSSIWGIAVDDKHDINWLYDLGYIQAWVDTITEAGILSALNNGTFVANACNFGVTPGLPKATRTGITITCVGATRIRFIGVGGVLLSEVINSTASYNWQYNSNDNWVRIEAVGAFTDPFDAADNFRYMSGGTPGASWGVAGGLLQQTATDAGRFYRSYLGALGGDFTFKTDLRVVNAAEATREAGVLFLQRDENNTYFLTVTPEDGNLTLNTIIGGVIAQIGLAAKALVSATWYTVKVQYTYATNIIRVRIWETAGAEPATWDIEVVDTTWKEGYFGFSSKYEVDYDNAYIEGYKTYYQPVQRPRR